MSRLARGLENEAVGESDVHLAAIQIERRCDYVGVLQRHRRMIEKYLDNPGDLR